MQARIPLQSGGTALQHSHGKKHSGHGSLASALNGAVETMMQRIGAQVGARIVETRAVTSMPPDLTSLLKSCQDAMCTYRQPEGKMFLGVVEVHATDLFNAFKAVEQRIPVDVQCF